MDRDKQRQWEKESLIFVQKKEFAKNFSLCEFFLCFKNNFETTHKAGILAIIGNMFYQKLFYQKKTMVPLTYFKTATK